MNRELFADLALRSQTGNRAAMEQLLLLAYAPVSSLCRKLLQNSRTARMMTREILTLIYTNLDSLTDPGEFESWIRRLTAARCMQALEELPPEDVEAQDVPNNVQIPRQTLDEYQTALAVQQMADLLPEQTRLPLLLYCCGGIEIEGIARLTHTTEDLVLEHLSRAQDNINKQLRKFHKMGIRFARITSLPELLCTSLYLGASPAVAEFMVNSILEKKPARTRRKKALRSPIPLLLAATVASALLLLSMLAWLFFYGV